MMELSKAKGKNVMLLTNDVAKDDWVDNNGKTFERYQIFFYAITGHSFVVHKYDDLLKDKIKIEPQVLEESKDNAKQLRIEDFHNSSLVFRFMLFYGELKQRIQSFMGPIRSNLYAFFRRYQTYINNDDIFNKLEYIDNCRNCYLHPGSHLFNDNAINYARAIDYTIELLGALPMIFQAISRAERENKQ